MIFVALEGIDNGGKTTLAKKIYDDLKQRQINVYSTKELLETDVGKIVLQSFRDKIELTPEQKALYFALDRQIRYESIIKQKYDVVIWDRYVYSSFVYREMEECDVNWVKKINSIFKKPELNIYVDVDIDTAMKRAIENKRVLPYTKEQLIKCKEIYFRYVKDGQLIKYKDYDWLVEKILRVIKK
jgi:dTMP kinase